MVDTLTKNVNAEGCLLGSMILDKECISTVRTILKDKYYLVKPEHRILFDCLCELSETSGGWDLIIIRDALKSTDRLEAVGGMEYLIGLAQSVPTKANAVYYAELVLKAYRRRRMHDQGESLQRAAIEPGDVQEALYAIQGDIEELASDVIDKLQIDGAEAVESLIRESIQNQRQIIKMPWSITSNLTKALQVGTITILCGTPGASKSFAVLELLAFVIECGHLASIYELENNKVFFLMRMLAQKTDLPDLTSPDWIMANPAISEAAHADNSDWLRQMGKNIFADGGGQVTYDTLTSWALRQARAGCKLLIFDPVTAIQHKTREIWQEDKNFLLKLKRIAVDYGASVVLVTHPGKTQGMPGMEGLAGGAAFSRFSQTILWLESHDSKTSDVRFSAGTMPTDHNRTIHILKSGVGRGQGLRIACTFTDTLRFLEHGTIVKKQRKKDEY